MSQAANLQEKIEQMSRQVATLQKENQLLRQKLDALIRRCFGAKSEKLDSKQLELLLSGLEEGSEESSEEDSKKVLSFPAKSKKRPRRIIYPENLREVTQYVDPREVQADPPAWRLIGEEKSVQLDYQPAEFLKRVLVRRKYALREDRRQPPVIAPMPPRLLEGGLATPGLLAQILIGKYGDHLPLYRQEQIFRQRHGVLIPRQRMVDWVRQCAVWLQPIYNQLRDQTRQSPYLQVDETPIRYLDRQAERGSRQGYLWTYLIPKGEVVYDWHASRGGECLESFLGEEFEGKLQCDGFSAYGKLGRLHPQIEIFGCWAHVRRKFFEAQEQAPRVVGWILNQMGWLYHWEAQLRESRAGPVVRVAHRQSHSQMVLKRLGRVFEKLKKRYLPQSLLGKAISYALNQWPMLVKFLEHGEVEIDNNLVENAIRPTAVGKKNWLFIGAEAAGWRSAVIFTLIESCRRLAIEPYTYLKDVLERLPSMTNQDVDQLTPANWIKAHRAAQKQAA